MGKMAYTCNTYTVMTHVVQSQRRDPKGEHNHENSKQYELFLQLCAVRYTDLRNPFLNPFFSFFPFISFSCPHSGLALYTSGPPPSPLLHTSPLYNTPHHVPQTHWKAHPSLEHGEVEEVEGPTRSQWGEGEAHEYSSCEITYSTIPHCTKYHNTVFCTYYSFYLLAVWSWESYFTFLCFHSFEQLKIN